MTGTNTLLDTGTVPIPVPDGGTGLATGTTAYAPVCTGTTATGAFQAASTGLSNSGYVLTSNGASSLPSFQAAGGGMSWAANSNTSITGATASGYITTAGSLATITLPTTFAVGTQIGVQGQGAGGWNLTAGTATTIQYGTQATSSAGSLASTNRYDNCIIIGIVANTTWAVITSLSSGLTVV
jgi:hypothetical protein